MRGNSNIKKVWYDLTDGQLRVFRPFVVEGRSATECYMTLYGTSNHFCKKTVSLSKPP